jgi:pimeloyl-ACP methyl ester carboxylesterase
VPVRPETRYARSGDVSIAYQEVGRGGPIDIVFVHGFVGNLEVEAENPRHEAFFERLGTLGRVIRFDRRGTGLSDRVREVPTLETRMDDLRAVMDAARSRRAVLVATFEAGSMAMVYAASYPERVAGLAVYNAVAKGLRSPDYPWAALSRDEFEDWLDEIQTGWGDRDFAAKDLRKFGPSIADDLEMQEWWARVMRLGAGPGAAVVIARMGVMVDVRDILSSIRVPTLILHGEFARGEAVYISERIPHARRVEIGGPDRLFWLAEGLADEIIAFAPSVWASRSPRPCSRPSCSRTSSTRRNELPSWETGPGRTSSNVIMRSSGHSWISFAAASWIRQVTVSSRPSTARSALSAAPRRSRTPCAISASRSEQVCTRANAKASARSLQASR